MLALTRESTTTGLARISVEVPSSIAEKVENAIRGILALADLSDNDDEKVYTSEEVFPENTPGDRLQGLRVMLGLTQEQMAQKLGVRQTYISALENANRPISIRMAKKIAKTFDTDYRIFL